MQNLPILCRKRNGRAPIDSNLEERFSLQNHHNRSSRISVARTCRGYEVRDSGVNGASCIWNAISARVLCFFASIFLSSTSFHFCVCMQPEPQRNAAMKEENVITFRARAFSSGQRQRPGPKTTRKEHRLPRFLLWVYFPLKLRVSSLKMIVQWRMTSWKVCYAYA